MADLEALVEHLESAEFDPGERVYEQGDEADGALIVVQGQLEAQIASGGSERMPGQRSRRNAAVRSRLRCKCSRT